MIYSLAFKEDALKEWKKLDSNVRNQFKKKLEERLLNPRVPAAKLSGHNDRFKIKLRNVGYRLVYEILSADAAVQSAIQAIHSAGLCP